MSGNSQGIMACPECFKDTQIRDLLCHGNARFQVVCEHCHKSFWIYVTYRAERIQDWETEHPAFIA